jgi:enoyl-CoA hydratase
MADEVLIERRGRVLLVTLNRPDARNAINTELTEGLIGAIEELDEDDGLTAAVLTGAGKGFCSGMDLKAFAAGGPPRGLPRILEQGAAKPMIAAIEGFAMAGGLELALTCDLLVAARGAKLGIPEVGVGLFAAGGGLYRLPQRLPYGVAMELALTADPITAERAFEYGLVTRLADPGGAVDEALALAERIACNAPLAVAASKRLIRAAQGCDEADFWALQKPLIPGVFGSEDAKEGPRAFAEKRAPVWSGR